MKTAQEWYKEGKTLVNQRKLEEADKCINEAIKLDPKIMEAYEEKCTILFSQGKFGEVVTYCDKALAIDAKHKMSLFNKGRALYTEKKYTDALVWLDRAIELYPDWATPYNTKGNTLRFMGKLDEAIKFMEKAADLNKEYSYPLKNAALIYDIQGNTEKAVEFINKAIARTPDEAMYYADKGTFLKKLGRKKEALDSFREANKLFSAGSYNIDAIPSLVNWMKGALASLDELEKAQAEAEATIKKADQSNPVVKNLVDHLVTLQKQKDKITDNMIDQAGKSNSNSDNALLAEMEKLKNQFKDVQQQLAKVQTEVKAIKNEIQDVKEELANKMDDFNKKLENELNKKDISPENKAKIKDYFKAFIGTWSSIYVTSQVIDSGQVQLDSDTTKATILSMMASFAPFVGNFLQKGIKSLGDFLQSKEMKTNARKVKRIAHDSTTLSQIVGESAYEIVLHPQKQEQILKITSEDLRKTSNGLLQKIAQICDNIQEQIDSHLYTQLYTSPAARLGHNDANKLVEDWINDKIDAYEISKHFVKETTNLDKREPETNNYTEVKQGNRSACCNMF